MKPSRAMSFGLFDYATFLSFIAYAAGSVIVPVALVVLARDLGFTLEEGGMSAGGALHLGRSVPMVVALLLSGFAAGHWGKRRSFGWSVVLMAVGVMACAAAPVYGVLLLALMIAGFAEGIIEGLATPFVQDLHPDEPGRYINFTHSFWSVGVLITVLLSGGLLTLGVSWRVLIAATGAVGLVAAAMLLLPIPTKRPFPEHPERIHWGTTLGHAITICRIPGFWLFFAAMFMAGGGEFCLTFWCASYIQLNFVNSAWAGGLGTACFAGGMVLGRTGWGYLINQHQLKHLIVWSALAGVAITVLFPYLRNLNVFFVLLFLSGIATAPFWPSIQSYSADRLPSTDTTMLFILLSCAGIPGCGIFAWLMGYLSNQSGDLSASFLLVPACYLTIAILIGYDWWRSTKEARRKAEAPAAKEASESLVG